MKNKVSFDYDGTLEISEVREFAEDLKALSCELWIVSSRLTYRKAGNDDLYAAADALGIPHDRVHLTNRKPKADFFADNPGFRFHLDDDYTEIEDMDEPKGIWYMEDEDWKKSCLDTLEV